MDLREQTVFPVQYKQYDRVTFDVLRVNLDELAGQITLNDLRVFKRISVNELTSCAWTKKIKLEEAPNIVEFTQNFNSVSYLTCREVLSGHTPEHRSQLISYFIRLAKKLYQLNNLHATYAVISSLSTQPIFRLEQTWQPTIGCDAVLIAKQLLSQFAIKNQIYRMDRTSMPCIPHLGLYLTDILFMNDMLKKTPENGDRRPIQENIDKLLRSLCSFQDSRYDISDQPHINSFLQEAQLPLQMAVPAEKLFYQLSLRLEPNNKQPLDKPETGRRSSLPLQAIRSLTNSAARFSPNIPSLKSPRRKKSLVDILTPGGTFTRIKSGRSSLGDDRFNGVDNASFAISPLTFQTETHSKWYDTLENDDDDNPEIDSSLKMSRFADLTKRLRSFDIYETTFPAIRNHLTPRSASGTPKIKKRSTFTGTPELLRRSKTPTPAENCSLLGLDETSEVEASGIFTRTQTKGSNYRNKFIRNHQTCYVELRSHWLVEYERKLVPLYVNEDRELFQQRPKRIVNLADGGWKVSRSEIRPGFCLSNYNGREYEYTCKSWTIATHWLGLIKEAIEANDGNIKLSLRSAEATRL